MKTLQIDGKKAKSLFSKATTEFQEMLIDSFGKDFFSTKITDRVKTFEDACDVLGLDPNLSLPKTVGNDADESAVIAHAKLLIIARALNEGWKPNWTDSNEYKYYPWFTMDGAFQLNYVSYSYANSYVSSRLCFKNSELAEYAANQFTELYKTYFTI